MNIDIAHLITSKIFLNKNNPEDYLPCAYGSKKAPFSLFQIYVPAAVLSLLCFKCVNCKLFQTQQRENSYFKTK